MTVNQYDSVAFFQEYAKVKRSRKGLSGTGEWHQLRQMFPPLAGKSVLDLGCGYGWHYKYAVEQGTFEVLGIDASWRMLEEAKKRNAAPKITYRLCEIGAYEYPENCWDWVISNLALHYIADLDDVFARVYQTLKSGGFFL